MDIHGFLSLGLIVLVPVLSWADSGTLRLSEIREGRGITIFTAPTPLRVGLSDVSILVQDADSGKPIAEESIAVIAFPLHRPSGKLRCRATIEAATNKLMRSASLHFSEPGTWRMEVHSGGSPLGFDVEVGEALPAWLDMALWIGWPLGAVGLFVLHQSLKSPGKR